MDTLHQPLTNELHIRTGLAESSLTLPSDDVALPRTADHDGLGHTLSLKPETGLGFKKNPNHHDESRSTSQILAVEEPTHETEKQRRRTEWRSVRRLFPNRRPQQMAFCSAVARQRFCSAFCWAAACSDDVRWVHATRRHRRSRRRPQQNVILLCWLLPNSRPTDAILFHYCSVLSSGFRGSVRTVQHMGPKGRWDVLH